MASHLAVVVEKFYTRSGKMTRRIKVVMVPFSYPDYPEEVINKYVKESIKVISDLDIQLVTTKVVKESKNVEEATTTIRSTDFDFIIALVVSWVEAPHVVATLRDFFSYPILLWSHTPYQQDGERITLGGIPAAGVIRETLEEMKANFEFIWGMPDSEDVKRKILSFGRTARSLRALSKSQVGLLGYFSMGMYTGGFDHTKIRKLIGPEIIHLGQYYIVKRSEQVESSEVQELVQKSKREWALASGVTEQLLTKAMKVYLALKNLVREYELDALTIKCQYELSREWGFAPCIPLSMLGDEIVSSCEGDVPLVISQLLLHYMSGKTVGYGDVHDILPDNSVILAACGFAPLSFALEKPRIGKHTALYEGLLNCSVYKEGEVTLCRLASDGDGYKMHITSGKAVIPPPFHEINCPPYAGTKIILDDPAEQFMQKLMSQHYAIVYGNFREELLRFCHLLQIRPVIPGQ